MDTTAIEPQVIEVTSAGSPGFPGLLAVRQSIDAEVWPDDPPTPATELAAELFAPSPDRRKRAWLATLDGEPVGAAQSEQHLGGVNDATIQLGVLTPAAHRRQGVGRRMAAVALRSLAEDGATSVLGWPLGDHGHAFCQALGMTDRQEDRASRLRIADLDAAQQRRWIDEAPGRDAGYRMVGWVGDCPDEWAEPLARALDAMVDAPIDDMDWTPQAMTQAQVQDRERAWDAQGYDVVTTLALAPDGSAAGASQLLVSRLRPSLGRQGDTGVVGAHRGHGLGRWLKAENLRRALAHEPAMTVVETFNAARNPHMLAINVEMGFRPYRAFHTYQGSVAAALAAVGAS